MGHFLDIQFSLVFTNVRIHNYAPGSFNLIYLGLPEAGWGLNMPI